MMKATQPLRGVSSVQHRRCPSLRPLASRPSRRAVCRVSAVLQERPGAPVDDEGVKMERARKAIFEALLGPSLSTSQSTTESGDFPPAPVSSPLEAGCVWHFSYGCNLAFSSLARSGVKPLGRDAAMVVDPTIRMRFRHRGGYATLESVPAHSSSSSGQRPLFPPFDPHVHGVLYKLRAEDLDILAKKESGYVLQEIEVQTYDGRRVVAQTFVSGPLAKLPTEVKPPEKYMRALREGAADNYLDPLHQAWLSSIETVSSAGLGAEYFNTPSKLVAYGFMAVAALLVVGFFVQH